MVDLDEEYGVCWKPKLHGPQELQKPASWMMLNAGGAKRLRAFFKRSSSAGYQSATLATQFSLLWVIDRSGNVAIGLEEALSADPHFWTYPLPRAAARDVPRLGHPALVSGDAARIGGELRLDLKSGTVYLTNQSGRFGYGREQSQLEKAAERFRELGIPVTTHFEDPAG